MVSADYATKKQICLQFTIKQRWESQNGGTDAKYESVPQVKTPAGSSLLTGVCRPWACKSIDFGENELPTATRREVRPSMKS